MYQKIGEMNPTYLLSAPEGAEIIAVPCEPGNGEVQRGTLMYRKESGMYAPATASDVTESNSFVVLNEDVNTDANEKIAENAAAFRSGRFITGKVMLSGEGTITSAHMLIMRKQGILFNQMVETAPEFNNKKEG